MVLGYFYFLFNPLNIEPLDDKGAAVFWQVCRYQLGASI